MLTIGEVADCICYDQKTIRKWLREGKFPPPIVDGKSVRWSAMSIGVWLAWREHGPREPMPTKGRKDDDSRLAVKGN